MASRRQTVRNWRGWMTQFNALEAAPEGALATASNVSFRRPGVISSRTGIARHSTIASFKTVENFFEFDGYIFAHVEDSGGGRYLQRTQLTTWTQITGSYDHPDPDHFLSSFPVFFKLHGARARERYYFVERYGVRRLDTPISDPVFAGAPKCPDIDRYNSTTADGATGILAPQTQTAYAAVIYYEDASGRRDYGFPSGRCVFRNENASGGSNKIPVVRVLLPKQNGTDTTALTTSYGVQLYRSSASPDLSTDPLDEMGLVYEAPITSTNITNGYVAVTDVTPDGMQGAALYTNQTQQGALNGNEPPPFAKCIASYQGCLLLANLEYRHRFEFSILSVDTTNGILDGDTITIANGADDFTLTAKGTPAASDHYKLETGATTTSQKIALTAQNLCAAINRHADNTFCYARYIGSPSDPRTVGSIAIEARQPGAYINGVYGLNVYVGASDNNACFHPMLPQDGGTTGYGDSSVEQWPNGWALSKPNQPDAFPLLLNGRMGAGNVVAIGVLDDEAFFFHDSGEVWRMSGAPSPDGGIGTLFVERWRENLSLLGGRTVQKLDDRLLAFTNQGVVALNGGGYEIISTPIRPELEALSFYEASSDPDERFSRRFAWSAANPRTRRYVLGLYDPDIEEFRLFIYNSASGTWEYSDRQVAAGSYITASYATMFYGARETGSTAYVYYEPGEEAVFESGEDGLTTAIAATVTTHPITSNAGEVPRQLREIQLVFISQPASVSCTITTEHGSASVSSVATQGSRICRIPVPRSVQRGARHTISLSISSTAAWQLHSMVLLLREYGARATK